MSETQDPPTLTLNIGSSSLKFAVFGPGRTRIVDGSIDQLGSDQAALTVRAAGFATPAVTKIGAVPQDGILPEVARIVAAHGVDKPLRIAHRVVHGGWIYDDHARVTSDMLDRLGGMVELAPNHLPREIAFMKAALAHFPDAPQVACFDTVFHRDLPPVARRLALPRHLETSGVRRYGFHGLSYEYLLGKLPDFIGDRANGRVVLAHLGGGASLAAVKQGKPVDTTMSLTPLGGLMMATRCGDIDPGIASFLERTHGLSSDRFQHMAYAESGLLGVSETSGDVRDLLARENEDPRAAEALALFCYQARKWIAAMTAALEGIDVLVFSGGIGAHSAVLRQRIADDLDWMGLTVDPQANSGADPCISAPTSKVMAFALQTDEELVMARIAERVLGQRV